MNHNMRLLYFLLILIFVVSCKNKTTDSSTVENNIEENSESIPSAETKYTLLPFGPSENFNDAKLTLKSYKEGKFDFDVQSKSYELGVQTPDAPQKMCANSAQGQHIHLILDTAPYAAKYTSEFDYDIEDGEYHMLAFLSRSYHESIKTPSANIAKKIVVKNKSIVSQEEISGPMIFYSRPKGTYVGKANTDKVMLDFYVKGANVGSDYLVKANINGEEHTIDKWQPYYIEGLPMGTNKITLTLVNKDGSMVDVPNNPVTREFELKEDPGEEM